MENQDSPPNSLSRSLLGSYGQFLRSPELRAAPEILPRVKIRNHILRLYSPHLIATLLIGVVISQFIDQQDSALPDILNELSAWFLFFSAVIAAPLIEECIFRLPLRGTVFNVALSGSLIAFLGVAWATGFNGPVMTGVFMGLVGLNVYLWFTKRQVSVLQSAYGTYPRVIFYGLTVLFGGLHITNYGLQVWPLLPLLVMPQIVIGLWLGFVRLRYGFGWAIFAHGFHNGCLLLPLGIIKIFGSERLQTQGLEAIDVETLEFPDQLVMVGVGLYVLGGLVYCAMTAWKVVREWRSSRAHQA